MHDLINATSCRKKYEEQHGIKMSKQYFSELKTSGKIPNHYNPESKTKIYIYSEVEKALIDMKDPTRDPQRESNAVARGDDALFDEKNIPENSLATMSDEEREEYDNDLKSKLGELQNEAEKQGIEDMPDLEGSAKDWNTYKIKEQGLTYAIKRKQLAGELMTLAEFKAILEIFLNPMSQHLDDQPYKLKAKFPNVDNDVIEWLIDDNNRIKAEMQNDPL